MGFFYKQKTLNSNKETRNALQSIKGVGWYKSLLVCSKAGIGYPLSFTNINIYVFFLITSILDYITILEVRIKRYMYEKIANSYAILSYKGLRHKDSLPCRGQRTRTNASTKKKISYKLKSNLEQKLKTNLKTKKRK